MLLDRIKNRSLSEDRKAILDRLVLYLQDKSRKGEAVHLNFICTHNSRRSQFAQFWSEFFSHEFNKSIHSYSGGTEVTACHPNVISALERLGFEVTSDQHPSNPTYYIHLGEGKTIHLFSKLHTEPVKGIDHFAALMCCSDAGENCPYVPGTEITIPLYYVDPKWADGTESESKAYDECCSQIASELLYVYSNI